jgi:hypothetical protein
MAGAGPHLVSAGPHLVSAGPFVEGSSFFGPALVVNSGPPLFPWEPWAVEDADVNLPIALHKASSNTATTSQGSLKASATSSTLAQGKSLLTTLAPCALTLENVPGDRPPRSK